MSLTLGKSLLFANTIRRCSVVPYTVRDGVMYFLLGRDRIFHNLTDLGGGVKKCERHTRGGVLSCGMREFEEESNGVFGDVYYSMLLLDQVAIVDDKNKMAAVFLPVDEGWVNLSVSRFTKEASKKRRRERDEIEELVWVSETEFENMLTTKGVMWSPLRKFYSKTFNGDLKKALRFVFSH